MLTLSLTHPGTTRKQILMSYTMAEMGMGSEYKMNESIY